MQGMISATKLSELVQPTEAPVASMLIPTERAGADIRQNRPRLKNLADAAERQLSELGVPADTVKRQLATVRQLLDQDIFWRYQGEGLAVYAGPESTEWFKTPIALPEVVTVTDRRHVKPLMPLAAAETRAFVLELSGQSVRLMEVTLDSYRRVELPDLPESYDEAMVHDDPEKQVQFHTGTSGANAAATAGERSAIHHGQGATHDEDVEQRRWRQFCEMVENAVTGLLTPTAAPLLLAAAEPTATIFRELNQYPHLMDRTLEGNHDHLDLDSVHREAVKVLGDQVAGRVERVKAAYAEVAGTPQTTEDLLETVVAADDGRIATLLVAGDVQRWGTYKQAKRLIEASDEQAPGRDDLLNFAACRAFDTGAEVCCISQAQMPTDSPIASTLRVAM